MHLPTATGEVGPPRSILTFDEEDENKFTNRRDGSIPKGEKFCIAVKVSLCRRMQDRQTPAIDSLCS